MKSVKTRIAGALGIVTPPPGRTIPLLKSERSGDLKQSDVGGTSFSIFGSKVELIHFEE